MSLPYQPTLNFSPLSKNHGESSTLSAELVQLTQFSFKVSLDMATITAKHKIDTIVGGGADARVNSLVEGGPLKMGPEHRLAIRAWARRSSTRRAASGALVAP